MRTRTSKRDRQIAATARLKAYWAKRPTEELQRKLKLREVASPGAKVIVEILGERGVEISN